MSGLSNFVYLCIPLVAVFVSFFLSNNRTTYLYWTLAAVLMLGCAWLAPSVWFLVCVAVLVAGVFGWRDPLVTVSAFVVLLPLLPTWLSHEITLPVPGMRYLMDLTYPRLLAITLLVPLSIKIGMSRSGEGRLLYPTDKYVFGFIGVVAAFDFLRAESLTEGLRIVFYMILDYALVYYVVSRCLNTALDFQRVFVAFAFSAAVVASIGIVEELKNWLIYIDLPSVSDIEQARGSILHRYGLLRVEASLGHPLKLGTFLVFALGVAWSVRRTGAIGPPASFLVPGVILVALLFTVSRGPWIGAVILFSGYLVLSISGRSIGFPVVAGLVATGAAVTVLLIDPPDEFSDDSLRTLEYRQELLVNGWQQFRSSPWAGSGDFLESDTMEESRQGQGIIDLVNTYLTISLKYGLVGIVPFCLLIIHLFVRMLRIRAFGTVRQLDNERNNTLLSIGAALVFMLAGVGLEGATALYFWLFAALCSAHVAMSTVKQPKLTRSRSPATERGVRRKGAIPASTQKDPV